MGPTFTNPIQEEHFIILPFIKMSIFELTKALSLGNIFPFFSQTFLIHLRLTL